MSELKYRIYCCVHHTAKRLLGRSHLTAGKMLLSPSVKTGVSLAHASRLWMSFIQKSVISSGDFRDNYYAGYIAENKVWCLPSWIWTNAAIVRSYCLLGNLAEAVALGEVLASRQQDCGGWIVRFDYDKQGAIPMLAPNDSAYIANNAFLTLY